MSEYWRDNGEHCPIFWGLLAGIAALMILMPTGRLPADQPWKMFADQVKREKEAEKTGKPVSDPKFPDSGGFPSGTSGTNSAADPDREPGAETEAETGIEADSENTESAPEMPDAAPRTPVAVERENRLIDFTESLGPDASQEYAVRIESPQEEAAPVIPMLPPYRGLTRFKNDAALRDVYFVNSRHGWAVGDRGTIWTTLDGGANWFLTDTPTADDLFAVRFLDDQFGVAVGGTVQPGGQNGRGVILITRDGGGAWEAVPTAAFPILRSVQILSESEIIAAGDSSELYPSGLFISQDAGATWEQTERGNRHAGWRKIAYQPAESRGIGIGAGGTFQILSSGKTDFHPELTEAKLYDFCQMTAGFPLWSAGAAGLILQSDDDGNHWHRSEGLLPAGASEQFDFLTVFAAQETILVAGNPGTRVFLSIDGGRNWSAHPTGLTVPIRRLFFTDPLHGWGIGDLGNIIATIDGGHHWTVQREGGRRLAFMELCAEMETLRPELFVRLSGDEGYLGGAALLIRPASNPNAEVPPEDRFEAAVLESLGSGAVTVGRFQSVPGETAPSVESILNRFDEENDGKGLERFRESVVRLIRTWRPDLLVIRDPALPPDRNVGTLITGNGADAIQQMAEYTRRLGETRCDSLRHLIERELPALIAAAQKSDAYPEQISVGGLAPWRVERVEKIIDEEGGNTLPGNFYSAMLGRDISEIASAADAVLGGNQTAANAPARPYDLYLATLYNRRPQNQNQMEKRGGAALFSGREIPYGSEARRLAAVPLQAEGIDLIGRNTNRRRLFALLQSADLPSDPGRLNRIVSDVDREMKNLDPELAVEYLTKTAQTLAQSGDWPAAEEIFSRVAADYSDLPAARTALLWLIPYYAGSEPFWRTNDNNKIESSEGEVADQTISVHQAIDPNLLNSRFHNADELGKLVRSLDPDLYMTPEIRFPLAVVQRRRGYDNDALRYFLNRSMLSKDDLWGIRAKAEFQLLAPPTENSEEDRLCPLSIASCRTTANRPYLDGELEPEIWNQAARFSLSDRPEKHVPRPGEEPDDGIPVDRGLSTEFGTFISLLYDAQFFYIGVEAHKTDSAENTAPDQPRRRDADLSDQDRVEFQFDLDRDYTTAYRFIFSRNGDVTDSCWNRTAWDSRCFVASHETENVWTLEIAIPWEELAERPPAGTDIWAVSFRRIVPDRGIECWNVENSRQTQDAYGLLTFGNH